MKNELIVIEKCSKLFLEELQKEGVNIDSFKEMSIVKVVNNLQGEKVVRCKYTPTGKGFCSFSNNFKVVEKVVEEGGSYMREYCYNYIEELIFLENIENY